MESIDSYFVALSPTHNFDDSRLKKTALILGTDDYNIRLLLAGEMPRIVAQFQAWEPAAALARELAELGLSVIAGSNLDLRQAYSRGFIAQVLQPDEKNVIFHDRSGETASICRDDALLILEGLLADGAEKKESKTIKTLNLPVSLLLGGIPVWSKYRTNADTTSQNDYFLRFYRPTSPEPVLEIRSGDLDYSFLGEKKSFSSTENFKTAVATMRSLFPHAVYDSRLTRNSRANASSSSSKETLERDSRLIYLFYVASQADHPKV
jgi:hypothetical protein